LSQVFATQRGVVCPVLERLDWFKSGGPDFSLVCDWADLPAEAVQDHAYELLGTPAERRSRTLRQVVWRAPVATNAVDRAAPP